MFKEFFLYEFKYWFRRPLIYIYFGIFFVVAFGLMSILTGLFDFMTATTDHGRSIINSATSVQQFSQGVVRYAYFLIPALIGSVIYRDFQYNMHSIIFTTPITKFGYMVGRLSAGLIITLLVFFAMELGLILAAQMPWVSDDFKGPFRISVYLQHLLYMNLPNIILFGSFVFAVTSLSRKMIWGYIIVVILYMCQGLMQYLLADMDNLWVGALLDPYGSTAVSYVARNWSVIEQNNNLLPFSGILLYNRILWTGVGLLFFAFTFWRFRFSQFGITLERRKKTKVSLQINASRYKNIVLPKVIQDLSFRWDLKLMLSLAISNLLIVIKSLAFLIIVGVSLLILFAESFEIGTLYDTQTYPVTRQVIEMAGGTFSFFILILTFIYSGFLLTRENRAGFNQFTDTTPVKDWVVYLSKFLAIVFMQIVLYLVCMLGCMIIQGAHGYFNFELHLYIKAFFGIAMVGMLIWTCLAFFVHSLFRSYWIGFSMLIFFLIISSLLALIGVDSDLFKFNSAPETPYSDMNGYGYSIIPFLIYKFYWGLLGILLAIGGSLLMNRGTATEIKAKFKLAQYRSNPLVKVMVIGLLLLFVGIGFYIRNEKYVKNREKSGKEIEESLVEYEKTYGKYNGLAQPRIVDVKMNVDIFPKERKLVVNGSYMLENKTQEQISELYINYTSSTITRKYSIDGENAAFSIDTVNGFDIYKLAIPLEPGEKLTFRFTEVYAPNGPLVSNSPVKFNGTFFNNGQFPTIGYSENAQLSGVKARQNYGLPPLERMALVDDIKARMNHYISDCSDWVDFEATISTSKDQIAIAPGYLLKEWKEGNRRYFNYKMDSKILGFFSFISADYKVEKDVWSSPRPGEPDVSLEVYYIDGHEYNVRKMLNGIKKSLDYYTENFGPYQHRQLRIIEFPVTDGNFAQSFPNTIPYSEGLGFIAKNDKNDPKSIDYVLFVTAHEVAHQWWAHQVIGGKVQGATLMSEALAQYSAMMVMEKDFGKEKMRKFLKHELNSYLKNRKNEMRYEKPLYLVENQQYIHYNKGAVVMYALRDYIGEDSVNSALRRYLKDVAFQEPPYTNSIEFLRYIRAVTPDSLQYIVDDMFETITFYSNKVDSVSCRPLDNGKFMVDLYVSCNKMKPRGDSPGSSQISAESEEVSVEVVLAALKEEKMDTVAINDWIEVGIFGENSKGEEKVLYLGKHKISESEMKMSFEVGEKPVEVGVDPYNKLIDRNSDDNRKSL